MSADLVEYLAKQLVEKPDEVRVERVPQDDGSVALRRRVAPDEVGKVIGKQGRIAKAIRCVANAAAARHNLRAIVDIDSK